MQVPVSRLGDVIGCCWSAARVIAAMIVIKQMVVTAKKCERKKTNLAMSDAKIGMTMNQVIQPELPENRTE